MAATGRPAALEPVLRRLIGIALGAGVALLVITSPLLSSGSGDLVNGLARDGGRMLAAAAAVVSCALAARRAGGGDAPRAWTLLALSAAATFAGAAFDAGHQLATGAAAEFPSASEIGLLGAFPLTIAGLLAFPHARTYATGLWAALDLAMIALAVIFTSGAISPAAAAQLAHRPGPQLAAVLTYLLFDLLLLTAILVALRRSLATRRTQLAILLAGQAGNAVAVSVPPVLATLGMAPALSLAAAGSACAFALVAVAPWFPENRAARQEDGAAPWQLMLRYAGISTVVAIAVFVWLANGRLADWVVVPGAGLLVVLIAGQALRHRETDELLRHARQAESGVLQRDMMLKQIVEHAPQGLAGISTDRRIIDANPRLYGILHAPAGALTGAPLDAFIDADYAQRVLDAFDDPGAEETYVSEFQARRADGSEFWLHWSVTAIRRADGSVDYYMALFDDVTARREAEETAVANLAQLEELNRLKSEFVSVVSHEFRTGLVGIQGFSELLRDQVSDLSEVRALADEINRDAERLSRMITEMLDFDRLEAGKSRLDLRLLDLNELAAAAVERARVSTSIHHIETSFQPGLHQVLGDEDRVTQVIANLLNNAIKYSPNGGDIVVSTRTLSSGVELSVLDHGRGIPHEFISRLFGRYERYEDKHAGKIIGTGLGLAIARQIVEMLGGKISVESTVGQGSEFRIFLPLPAGRPTVPIERVEQAPRAGVVNGAGADPNGRRQ